ncbi:uncharacterized protein TNCV_4875681 [Trichonephila clavipes]|nr:uncharacterized protein TNCV_4875681 [Trichonephila clavipes]
MLVLKDTEASLDMGFEKNSAPEIFTGEQVSVRYILDNGMTCLRPAELEIECRLGHVVSKPVVSPVHLDKEKYNDQFGLGEYLVETEGNLVPSLTKEDQDTVNLIKINADEFIETQQKSKESAPLIQKVENGINNEVRDQEIAPMQLVPVRREIFSKLNVNRVGLLPIIPGNKHILPGMSMPPRCHEAVPVPKTASTPLVEALPQIFRRVFPREIQADREALLMSILTAELLQKLGVAAVAEWYRHRIVAGFVTSSSPVPLKTRRVGQRCTLNLSRAETSSLWCGVVVRRGCQLRCRPRHLTMVQNYVVRRQKPSCS